MESIGERCRELFKMRLYQQLTMTDIAAKMGFKNERNAINKHYKCKEELREIIMKNPEYRALLQDFK